MKLPILSALLIVVQIQAISQEKPERQRELGITISKFSFESIPFNLVYKKGKDNKFWRYEASYIGGQLAFPETTIGSPNSTTINEKSSSIGFGFKVGREFRNPITDKLTLYHGPKFGISGSYNERIDVDYSTISSGSTSTLEVRRRTSSLSYIGTPSLGYSIGAIINIKPNLYFSFDLSPSIYYSLKYQEDATKNNRPGQPNFSNKSLEHSTGFNFSQGAVSLGLFYTFLK